MAGACLELAENGHVELCLSEEILAEVDDVLKRPEIQSRFPSLTAVVVAEFIEALRGFGQLYPEPEKHFSYPRDSKDEPYLNLAIQAQAEFLVSRDKDILDLRQSLDAAAVEFRQKFAQIRIMEPLEFLRTMRADAGK